MVTTADDHHLRSLRAVIDFGAAVPEELREALCAYAGARLEVRLTMAPLEGTLRLEAPADVQDL